MRFGIVAYDFMLFSWTTFVETAVCPWCSLTNTCLGLLRVHCSMCPVHLPGIIFGSGLCAALLTHAPVIIFFTHRYWEETISFRIHKMFGQFSVLFVPPGGGGYSSEFLVGVCRPVPQILTQFQTKIFHFPHPFSDLAPKIHTRFQTFVVS